MTTPLTALPVLVVDCQASGATPAHGDLLEIAWAVANGDGLAGDVHATWLVPATDRPVSVAVRRLTGWDETCTAGAVTPEAAWTDLLRLAQSLRGEDGRTPAAIHWARFELGFLRPLAQGAFPLDVVCVHAVAERLHPDLPRRSLRALAGHLGFPAGTARRAADHVEATAFVWGALARALAERGVGTWAELETFLRSPKPKRPTKRTFPLDPAKRRSLPDRPGVYRFLRRSGDVLYVGKATSLKRRVASHFTGAARATERALEMLTQVDAIEVTETPSTLEAALLECDEIKRLDPPYNVQLRRGARRVWWASRDLLQASPAPGDAFPVGPLPSEHAARAIGAMRALARGAAPSSDLRRHALHVPPAFVPDEATFTRGLALFVEAIGRALPKATPGWLALARELGAREDAEEDDDEAPATEWTPELVRDQLVRAVAAAGGVVERARRIRFLATSRVAFVEGPRAHTMSIDEPEIDVDRYDRLRVLVTELARLAATEDARVEVVARGHRLPSRHAAGAHDEGPAELADGRAIAPGGGELLLERSDP